MSQPLTSVLVVDDDPRVLAVFRRLGRRLRLDLRFAASAEEAQSLVDEQLPGLIICDYRLPGLDGLSFLEKVHARFPEIRRVLHTGEAVFRVNLGLDVPLLPKPCPVDELEALLLSAVPTQTSKA